MNDREAEAIAQKLGLSKDEFLRLHAYPYDKGFSIRERANGDCVFLNGAMCGIYDVRPTQCQTFPFWPEILRSEKNWKATAKACEGIGRGRTYEKEEIMSILNRVMNECHDAEW